MRALARSTEPGERTLSTPPRSPPRRPTGSVKSSRAAYSPLAHRRLAAHAGHGASPGLGSLPPRLRPAPRPRGVPPGVGAASPQLARPLRTVPPVAAPATPAFVAEAREQRRRIARRRVRYPGGDPAHTAPASGGAGRSGVSRAESGAETAARPLPPLAAFAELDAPLPAGVTPRDGAEGELSAATRVLRGGLALEELRKEEESPSALTLLARFSGEWTAGQAGADSVPCASLGTQLAVALTEAEAATRGLPRPNAFLTSAASRLLLRSLPLFGRYQPLMALLACELLRAVYADFSPPSALLDPGAPALAAEALPQRPHDTAHTHTAQNTPAAGSSATPSLGFKADTIKATANTAAPQRRSWTVGRDWLHRAHAAPAGCAHFTSLDTARRRLAVLERQRQSYSRERAWVEQELARRVDVFTRTVRHWAMGSAARCFHAWRGVAVASRGRSKRLHTLFRRVVDAQSNLLSRTFGAWCDFAFEAREERQAEAIEAEDRGVEEETARRDAAAADARSLQVRAEAVAADREGAVRRAGEAARERAKLERLVGRINEQAAREQWALVSGLGQSLLGRRVAGAAAALARACAGHAAAPAPSGVFCVSDSEPLPFLPSHPEGAAVPPLPAFARLALAWANHALASRGVAHRCLLPALDLHSGAAYLHIVHTSLPACAARAPVALGAAAARALWREAGQAVPVSRPSSRGGANPQSRPSSPRDQRAATSGGRAARRGVLSRRASADTDASGNSSQAPLQRARSSVSSHGQLSRRESQFSRHSAALAAAFAQSGREGMQRSALATVPDRCRASGVPVYWPTDGVSPPGGAWPPDRNPGLAAMAEMVGAGRGNSRKTAGGEGPPPRHTGPFSRERSRRGVSQGARSADVALAVASPLLRAVAEGDSQRMRGYLIAWTADAALSAATSSSGSVGGGGGGGVAGAGQRRAEAAAEVPTRMPTLNPYALPSHTSSRPLSLQELAENVPDDGALPLAALRPHASAHTHVATVASLLSRSLMVSALPSSLPASHERKPPD